MDRVNSKRFAHTFAIGKLGHVSGSATAARFKNNQAHAHVWDLRH